jgi:hypothetical protein
VCVAFLLIPYSNGLKEKPKVPAHCFCSPHFTQIAVQETFDSYTVWKKWKKYQWINWKLIANVSSEAQTDIFIIDFDHFKHLENISSEWNRARNKSVF